MAKSRAKLSEGKGREAARGGAAPQAKRPEQGGGPAQQQEGWEGWDQYAAFYDWENAQTLDRRDVKFWQDMARRASGPVLELGCGTGRVAIPVARTGVHVVGVDRSEDML